MKMIKKIAAVLLAAVMFCAVVPVKNNIVSADDLPLVSRDEKFPVFTEGIDQFFNLLYYKALGRETDPNGKYEWYCHLIYDGYTGADIVRGFLLSPEFINRNCTDEEFVEVLYQIFFYRSADAEGVTHWTGELANGMSRQQVIEGFIATPEWTDQCLLYGIPAGNGVPATIRIMQTKRSESFVSWLYLGAFCRDADDGTVAQGALALCNFEKSCTELAHEYYFSDELNNLSNIDWLTRIYRNLLSREPNGDFNDCLNMLNNGTISRESIFTMATEAGQWARTCTGFGLLK